MTIYTFSALVTFDVATHGGAACRYPDGPRTRCVVQASRRQYFPGMLWRDMQPRPTPAVHAQLSVALNDGEAEAFFTPGQRFTIWADAIVGTTICGDGFVGYGVIESQKSSAPPPCRCRQDPANGDRAGVAKAHGRDRSPASWPPPDGTAAASRY